MEQVSDGEIRVEAQSPGGRFQGRSPTVRFDPVCSARHGPRVNNVGRST